jgi:regulator of protease activity HflC (stomatin/prohibitin superfamily)
MNTPLPPAETAETPAPPTRRWTRGRIAPAVAAVWALSGVYFVAPDQQAVETLLGKVVAPRVMPGPHYALPWPIQSVAKLKVRQLQRLVVGGEIADAVLGRTPPLASQFLTGDQNIINMRVVVQYSVSVPADYLFQAQSTAQIVGAAVESELARRIAHRGVDACSPPKRPPSRKKSARRRRKCSTITALAWRFPPSTSRA